MSWEIFYLIILTTILFKVLPPKKSGVGDAIGSFMVTVLFYLIAKIVPHCLMGGWTYPVNPDPKIHMISGSIAFAAVATFYGLIWYCKKNNTNVWRIMRR